MNERYQLSVSLDAARQIYNASLGEALRRLDLMYESKVYRAACAFAEVRDQFGFTSGSIQNSPGHVAIVAGSASNTHPQEGSSEIQGFRNIQFY